MGAGGTYCTELIPVAFEEMAFNYFLSFKNISRLYMKAFY